MSLISYLTTIEFGAGVLETLQTQLAALGISRPLLVSDRGLERTGLVERVRSLCPSGTPAFLDVPTNPTEEAVLEAVGAFSAGQCDGIVALGGGSPIDLGKGVALLASHPGPLAQYAMILGGLDRITAKLTAAPGNNAEIGGLKFP